MNKEVILESANPLNIINLVQYNKDAIVSKTLIKSNYGSITLFAFDKGQGLSEHTAPFDAVVQIIEGEAEFKIGNKKLMAKAGDIFLMPANVPHAVKTITQMKMLLTLIKE